jgi:chromate transport protein ChrA
MKNKNKISILKLWWFYFSALLLSFGGGYTFIEIFREKNKTQALLTEEEFEHFFAWGQIIPGPLAFNFAILTSHHLKGVLFAAMIFITTVISPVILSFLFFKFIFPLHLAKIFFKGILLLLPLIIFKVILKQIKNFSFFWQYIITALSLIIVYFIGTNSFFYLIGSALFISFLPCTLPVKDKENAET